MKDKTGGEGREERKRRYEESKMKYVKKGKRKVNNDEDEIEIVEEAPAETLSVPPADTKLVERQQQSQVERLLAKSGKITATIQAKEFRYPLPAIALRLQNARRRERRTTRKDSSLRGPLRSPESTL